MHFVPAYDTWFDNTYTKIWGRKNDCEVIVDHINLTDLPARAASEVAARSGHDLFQHLSPPAAYEDQVIGLGDIIQQVDEEARPNEGSRPAVGLQPEDEEVVRLAGQLRARPRPLPAGLVGRGRRAADDVGCGEPGRPKLKANNHPIGIGMSNELDSNMALIALMQCFRSYIQNADARVTLNTKATRDAVNFMASLYRRGMVSDVFAWVPASNNNAMLAGRISLAFNAISIMRTAELQNPSLARNLAIAPIPKGPQAAPRSRARDGRLHDLEVRVQQASGEEVPAGHDGPDLQRPLPELEVLQLPRLARGGQEHQAEAQRGPERKYGVLDTISRTATTNVGYPGFSNAAIDEVFNTWLIPQMFAEVAQGRKSAADSVSDTTREVQRIFRKWRNRGKI